MSKTPATVALTRAGIPHTVHPYRHDRDAVREGLGYGEEAAEALGVQPARVLKTLVAAVDGELVVAVLPVPARLDLKALAAAVGGKRAEMAEPAAAQRATGYVLGGISPLGQRKRLRTVVDASALEHDSVYVSGGRRGLDIELSPQDLVAATSATVAPCTTA
ncbi:MAG TPA: Cys-tRNA(Pro) deacylase [Actinomycetales bacterium]|nr:Cys-tRNA(Pro) deacylase [Actinomycetales bacterium]